MRLNEIFKYPTVYKYNGLPSPIPVVDADTHVGIEVELEGITNTVIPKTWKIVEDGSLKVEGREFVSIPLKLQYVDVELSRLFSGLPKKQISARCSIHVHVDVRDLSEEELYKFLILYVIFEKALFNISGNRWDSNYCTPLYMSPDIVQNFVVHPYTTWYKYSALNLLPIYGNKNEGSGRYGTVEFRHHQGCVDKDEILNWINTVVSIKLAAKSISLEKLVGHIRTMNTTSTYHILAEQVFTQWSTQITSQPTFKEDVESCILMAKNIFFNHHTGVFLEFSYLETKQNIKVNIGGGAGDINNIHTLVWGVAPPTEHIVGENATQIIMDEIEEMEDPNEGDF